MSETIQLFKQCMGKFATGITIVTTKSENQNIGITINSFNSVSLSPLLILFSLNKKSYYYQSILNCKNFTVNILSSDQQKYTHLFSNHLHKQWSSIDLDTQNPITTSPAIKDCLAFLECEIYAKYDGGDHTIIVGKVIHLFNGPNNTPLVYYKGNFLNHS